MIHIGKTKGEVTFICNVNPQAKAVFLAGSFNQWQPQAKRMRKYKDGSFRAKLKLPSGTHQYKFLVDGLWYHDPDGPDILINDYDTINSVIHVG
jgi:1,4-alpha-glucan branching enzyme